MNQGVGIWPMGYTAKARVAGAWGPPQANWGGAAAGATTCNGQWPNDSAAVPVDGHLRIALDTGTAPTYLAVRKRPRITMPILNVAVTLPAGVIWPAGQALPPNTQLPLGSVWPGGVQAPLTGAVNSAVPFVLAAALPWPNGQTMGPGLLCQGSVEYGWLYPNGTNGLTGRRDVDQCCQFTFRRCFACRYGYPIWLGFAQYTRHCCRNGFGRAAGITGSRYLAQWRGVAARHNISGWYCISCCYDLARWHSATNRYPPSAPIFR